MQVRLLGEQRVGVDAINVNGDTPLMFAAGAGHAGVVSLLMGVRRVGGAFEVVGVVRMLSRRVLAQQQLILPASRPCWPRAAGATPHTLHLKLGTHTI